MATTDNPTVKPLYCPACSHELRVDIQPNYRRIDGQLTEIEPLHLLTCDNPDCPWEGFTVILNTWSKVEERRRYGIVNPPYCYDTGEYIPSFMQPWWTEMTLESEASS